MTAREQSADRGARVGAEVHVRVTAHDETGAECGLVEVDRFDDSLYLEVIDASHFNGKRVTATVMLTNAEAREVGEALLRGALGEQGATSAVETP